MKGNRSNQKVQKVNENHTARTSSTLSDESRTTEGPKEKERGSKGEEARDEGRVTAEYVKEISGEKEDAEINRGDDMDTE